MSKTTTTMTFDFRDDPAFRQAGEIFDEMFVGTSAADLWEADFAPIQREDAAEPRNRMIVRSMCGERETEERMRLFTKRLADCHVQFQTNNNFNTNNNNNNKED